MGKWIIIITSLLFLVIVGFILYKFRNAVNVNDKKVKKSAPMLVLVVSCFAVIVVLLTVVIMIFVAGR